MIVAVHDRSLSIRSVLSTSLEFEQAWVEDRLVLGEPGSTDIAWLVEWGEPLAEPTQKLLLCPETAELPPKLALFGDTIVVALDQSIFAVARDGLVHEGSLLTPVRALCPLVGLSLLLVVQEAGASTYDNRWRKQWHVDTDLIDGERLEGQILWLSFFDDQPVGISVADGSRVVV